MQCCDLHCHSTCSDGTFSPEEVVDLACQAGISALALTDHNTMVGIERFLQAAQGKDIEVCGGCEFTTEAEGQELHLVGLFLDPKRVDKLEEEIARQRKRKEQNNRETIERLAQDGYPLTYDEFVSLYGDGVKNRVHIANYLMKKGIIHSVSEAFKDLLATSGKYFKEGEKLDFYRMIPMIREAGGVSVWAHPLFHVDRTTCEQILIKAKAVGLNAMEVYYSTYTEEDTEFMCALADKYQILKSGGSDFHGSNKPGLSIGTGYGELCVPYECFETLKSITVNSKEQ